MNKRHSLSIRTHIMLLIFMLTMLPTGLIVFSLLQQQNQDIQAAKQLAERLADDFSDDQNMLLSGAEQLLSTISQIPAVQKHDVKAVNTLLAGLVSKNPQYANLLITDNTGLQWAAAIPVKRPVSLADRRYFRNAMASGHFSSGEYAIGRTLKIPVLNFAYPIKDAFGNITDVAVIVFTLEKYNQRFKSKTIPANTSLFLTDHKGTTLYNVTAPQTIGKQDRDDLFRRMSEGPEKGTFEADSNIGIRRYFAYQKLRISGEQTPYMYVRAGIPVETILGKTRSKLLFDICFMSIMLLLATGFAYYISKRGVVDKIIALRDAMQRVAQGDLDIHVSDYVSGGELGELGNAFDAMARKLADDITERKRAEDALQKLNEELEMRVAQRTEELEKIRVVLETQNAQLQETCHELEVETDARIRAMEDLREKDRIMIQQSRMAAMGEMLGHIAHQWRQPLNILGIMVQNLGLSYECGEFNKEVLDDNIGKAMEIVIQLSQTIDTFSNFAALNKEKCLFSVDQIIVKSISLVEESFNNKGIAIKTETTGDSQINGYVNEYAQVLLNILMNARDAFLDHESANAQITVRSWSENGRAIVTITDNAGGIREDILGKIFDAYFTTKELGKGSGVGLFMSKTIIEKNMGGRLTVRNTDDGAEFRIEV